MSTFQPKLLICAKMPSSPDRPCKVPCISGSLPGCSAEARSSPFVARQPCHSPFRNLPDAALQQICARASTPACPGPCLLAVTSKGFGAAAAQYVQDCPVQLLLGQSRPSSTMAAAVAVPPTTNILQLQPAAATNQIQPPAADLAACIQADCARLYSLARWMKRNGHKIGALNITSRSKYAHRLDYWQRSLVASGLAAAIQGLAAGRAAPGRLRLTTLDLEVLGYSQLQAALDLLSACQRLRRLHLTGPAKLHRSTDAVVLTNWKAAAGISATQPPASATHATTASSSMFRLGLSLSRMSALTHLQLRTDWLQDEHYYEAGLSGSIEGALDLDPLLCKLPPQLQELRLTGCQIVTLSLAAIKHLTQLRHLQLPCSMTLRALPTGVTTTALVSGLTQLSSLTCSAVLHPDGVDLLQLPGLQRVSNGSCGDTKPCRTDVNVECLMKLGSVIGLRALQLVLPATMKINAAVFIAMTSLVQLQHLTLPMVSSKPGVSSSWCMTLRQLTHLRSLDVSATLLLEGGIPTPGVLALKALTGLTRLVVNCKGASALMPPPPLPPPPPAVHTTFDEFINHAMAALIALGPRKEHPLGAVGCVLDLVQAAAGAGSLQQLELSWVDRPLAQVAAAAAAQLPGVVVTASEEEVRADG